MKVDKFSGLDSTIPMEAFQLSNDLGMKVRLTNIGASITDIVVANKSGNFENVVLKHHELKEYLVNENYLGATIGRFANRIADGSINIAGRSYSLSVNERAANNHLHGGHEGFGRKVWQVKAANSNSITFHYISPDGEEGYPGNLHTTVEYKLDNNNGLSVHYHAVTDQRTIVNLTNHSYFNLSGGRENILNHTLAINAFEYTPLDHRNLPLGYKEPVKQTIYDLQEPKLVSSIADRIINTNYCIDNNKQLAKTAVLSDHASGRRMTVYATMPGLQLYFGNFLSGNHKPFDGLCIEPQYYPNSPNIPVFDYKWVDKERAYEETIIYHFHTI